MKLNEISGKKRIFYIDLLKAFAILSVIAIHAAAPALSGFAVGSHNWYTAMFYRSVISAAVPLFFMCSGVLFLDEDKPVTVKKIYLKYILKIATALLFWAAAYEGFDLLILFRKTGALSFSEIAVSIKKILTFNTHFHLYYLYIIVLVYAFVPILRQTLFGMSKNNLKYFIGLWLLLGIILPFIKQFYPFTKITGIPLQYPMNMTYSAIGYCVFGYYINKYGVKNKKMPLIVIAAGICAVFFGGIALSFRANALNTAFFEGMTPGVAMIASGIFSLAKGYSEKMKTNNAVRYISKASLCIYLVHDFFNIIFRHFGFVSTICNPAASITALTLCNFALSLAVYFILSHIPVVNKYLV